MKRRISNFLAASGVVIAALSNLPAAAAANCEALAAKALPNTTITATKSNPAGTFTPAIGQPINNMPAFCEVHGVIKPTSVSAIAFEVWLPAENWNGKLEVPGNGGLAGTIGYAQLAAAVKKGFAAASTDTGHTSKEVPTWLEDKERLIDYSYRGLHLTTANAKSLADAYYGQSPKYSYFVGCSTGGKQGLMEAQRFPADFDGIVAGDAANYWTHQMAGEVWNGVVTSTPETKLSQEKLELVQNAAMEACDTLDGAKDGLISDPMRCHFDPKKLLCKGAENSSCLTAAQVGAVEKIYSGPVNPRTGKKVYAGMYPGGELGWWGDGRPVVINATSKSGVSSFDFFRYAFFHMPDWDYRKFDFDRDLQSADERLGPVTNATDPNLSEFRKLGHKMIYYHGTTDPLIPAQNGIDYYETVVAAQGKGANGLEQTQQFFRAYLVPGLYHCNGGPGPNGFGAAAPAPATQSDADHDVLNAAMRWVENGTAPEKIIATKYVDNKPANGIAFQRPLCTYPQVAKYKGSGDMKDAANFVCAKP